MSRAAVECPGEDIAAVPDHRHDEDGTMNSALAISSNTSTFLTRVFGRGLEDERYVVERDQAISDGEIHRWRGDEPATKKGRCRCTGLWNKGGAQYWGWIAIGLALDRKQKR